jgi:hypothetical protein
MKLPFLIRSLPERLRQERALLLKRLARPAYRKAAEKAQHTRWQRAGARHREIFG